MIASPALVLPRPPSRGLALACVVMAAAAVLGGLLWTAHPDSPWRWLHWVAKPLATLAILALAWRAAPALSARYRRWIVAGLACALAGDVLLMLPQDLFVPGLLAFLLAHGCFLAALLGDSRFPARWLALLLALGAGALQLALLWRSIDVPLRLPVIVYMAVLAGMAAQALGRAWAFARQGDPRRRSAAWAAAGALMFMLSDSVLAWNRFHAPLPLATLWVLGSYYLALAWIARSVRNSVPLRGAGTTA